MESFKEFQIQSDRLTPIMCELPQMSDSRWDRDMRGDIRKRWPSLTVWAGFLSGEEFQKLWLSLKIVNSRINPIFSPARLDLSGGQNWGFLASDLISGLGKREQAMQWGRECFTAGGHFSSYLFYSPGPLSCQASNFVPIYQIPGCREITRGKTNILGKHLLLKILNIPPPFPHHCVSPSWSRTGVVDWRGWTSAPTGQRSEFGSGGGTLSWSLGGGGRLTSTRESCTRESPGFTPLPSVTSSSSNI